MSGKSGAPGSRKKKDNEKKEQSGGSDQSITANTFTVQPEPDMDSDEGKEITATVQLLQQQLQQQQALIDQLIKQQRVKSEQQQPSSNGQTQPIQQLRIELFGVHQLIALGELPKFVIDDRFTTWRQQVEAFVGIHGLDPLVTKPPEQSWADAVALKPANVPMSMLQLWYLQAGKRIVHAISLAMINAGLDRDQLLADARADKPDSGVVTVGPLRIDVDANPYLIMQTLRQKYDTKTPYAAINIWKRLLASRWDPSKEKGSKHLQTLRNLFTQLDRIVADDGHKKGECFGETIKSIIMLNTLPQTFSTDVKILTTQEKITTAQVEAVIRKYDDMGSRATSKADPHTDRANAFTDARSQYKAKRQQQQQYSTQSKHSRSHRSNKSGRLRSSRHRSHSSDSSSSDDSSSDSELKYAQEEEPNQPVSFCLIDETTVKNSTVNHVKRQRSRVLLDSGASCHVWNDPSTACEQRTLTTPRRMVTVTGESVSVTTTGIVWLAPKVQIKDVAIVPTATSNLMSVDKITQAGYSVSFYHDQAKIRDNKWKVVLKFKKQDGLYVFYPDQEKRPSSPRQRPASRPSSPAGRVNGTADKSAAASDAKKAKQSVPTKRKTETAAPMYEALYSLY